ncbi:MAG: circularly permuted type 2 ATP-grasp protein [Methyloligellaceae bacterium]
MNGLDCVVREPYSMVNDWLQANSTEELNQKKEKAEILFRRLGITFSVYGDEASNERLIPFDIIPRIIGASEWRKLAAGIEQRVRALNAFMYDIYHRQEILKAKLIPEHLIVHNEAFLTEMIGVNPAGGVYSHIVGTDLVRTGPDEFFVLEDNTRTPSGVSYMLENRETMMQLFPELFSRQSVAPVENYPEALRETLASVAPQNLDDDPTIAVLTPGIHNSAYYEHSFLADQMGAELVEARDLLVADGALHMKTTRGLKQVDVLYKRIDDDFLDPLVFRSDSVLGVPGLFELYRAGRVTLANAPGTGIADDKSIYTYVPKIIEFYTGRPAILKNVKTYDCSDDQQLKYVLENLPELVVKQVHGSGGYGMLVGPTSSMAEIDAFKDKLVAKPNNYIAQPTLALSTCPTLVESDVAPRHVDLRPFVLVGEKIQLTPGGLTRVALREGSLVVNSSQGGGTKDTWVIEE